MISHTPSPRWVVKESDDTDDNWNSAIMSYNTLAAKIYRWPQGSLPIANMFRDMELNAKYGMSVDVATPMRKDGPKVSFFYRHQIHCWIEIGSKPRRRRGITVVAVNHIPDICTDRSLWIQEFPRLNLLVDNSAGNIPEGDVSPRPERTSEGIFSFATATASNAELTQARSWPLKYLKWPRAQKVQDEARPDIPYHPHVCRGWDHTNLRWQKIVWPKLDYNLQPHRGESAMVSRLDWRERDNAEDVDMEEPQGSEAETSGEATRMPEQS